MSVFGGSPNDGSQFSNHDIDLISTYVLTKYGASSSAMFDEDVALVRKAALRPCSFYSRELGWV